MVGDQASSLSSAGSSLCKIANKPIVYKRVLSWPCFLQKPDRLVDPGKQLYRLGLGQPQEQFEAVP